MTKVVHFQPNLRKIVRRSNKNCGNLQKMRQFAGHGQNCKLAASQKNCGPQDRDFLQGQITVERSHLLP